MINNRMVLWFFSYYYLFWTCILLIWKFYVFYFSPMKVCIKILGFVAGQFIFIFFWEILLQDIRLEAEESYNTDQLSVPFFGLLQAYQIHSGLMYGTIVRHLGRNFLKLVSWHRLIGIWPIYGLLSFWVYRLLDPRF